MNMALKSAAKIKEETALTSLEVAYRCATAADDKKAHDIQILEVGSLTSFADYFVICSAPSERQVQAIIKNVQEELTSMHLRISGVEGMESSAWVLIDLDDVIFHCFTDAAREYYDLEGFWIDAKRVPLPSK